ncbi:uncharacterized protein LOC129769334 isoform X2 [Toxorhynchites rutilus septentrionalis]|uniref:uncharacterized protein LOC129769334 isoform X2 n=1 Tax=Toxorhynchites rutilus septentrionalis TaxID=329112 RepID=UPI00247A8B49|nr:uncharacterized protein LOC129769334 isoform X2 [Toxorhynchites rutilus septentrionalis]
MEYREQIRWFLKRLHQNEHKIVNVEERTDISRSPRSAINLNKIKFQHISKQHCTISCENGLATLTDETSSSGTFVNDRKFNRDHPGSVILSEGDLVGIGTSCFNPQSFYESNDNVLLYQVCKDRNRIIRDGDVETILSSDEELEDIGANDLPQAQEEVNPVNPFNRAPVYRIVEQIDLSSDDEGVKCQDSVERMRRLDEGILAETEKRAIEMEQSEREDVVGQKTKKIEERPINLENDQKRYSGNAHESNGSHRQNVGNEQERRDCTAEVNNNSSRQIPPIKQEVQSVSEHYNGEKNDEIAEPMIIDLEQESDQIEDLFRDSYAAPSPERENIISVDDSDEDENDFSEQKLTQSFYRQIKQEALAADLEDDDEPEPVQNDEVPNIENVAVEQVSKEVSASVPVYISDEENEEDLEDSKRWFMRLSQRNSPLRSKPKGSERSTIASKDKCGILCSVAVPASVEPISIDDYCSRDQEIPTDVLEGLLEGICDEEPPPDLGSHGKRKMSLESIDDGQTHTEVSSSSKRSFEKNHQHQSKKVSENKENNKKRHDSESDKHSRVRKKMKSMDSTSSNTTQSTGLKPSATEARRASIHGKDINSASNVWISRKVPYAEPHRIHKRGMNSNAASSSKKHSKSSSSSSSSLQKPENKEIIKQKLKHIEAKKPETKDSSAPGSKSHTIPKVKFTPNNRGAFLTEEIPAPAKSNAKKRVSVPVQTGADDLVCTQSTVLDNIPLIGPDIDIPVTKAPKLTFDSVAKVSNVAQKAPAFKIPKRRNSCVRKSPVDEIARLLESCYDKSDPVTEKVPPKVKPTSEPDKPTPVPEIARVPSPGREDRLKSILKSPTGLRRKSTKSVNWKNVLSETRMFEIDEGNFMCTQTKLYKDNKEYVRDVSLASCRNDIVQEITSWNAEWFDNPSEAAINSEKLLPMVEEYQDFEDYKRIVLPILKTELFHDILSQYEEMKKKSQEPIAMKVNQIRSQGRTFVLNCSVVNSNRQSVNKNDYVLIIFNDSTNGREVRIPAVVTSRRHQSQYAAENGLKFYHCTVEATKTMLSEQIRNGNALNYRILSITQINMHMRQFHALFNLQNTLLLRNILSPRSNCYTPVRTLDPRTYKGKEVLNKQQGDTLLTVFQECLDMTRPHIMLIQGPPGTGKSRLICNLLIQLHQGMPKESRLKILVCAQSNTAVDVIVLKLLKLFRLLSRDKQCNILRTGTPNKVNSECKIVFLDYIARKHVDEQIKRRKLRDEDPIYETYFSEKESFERKIKHLQTELQRCNGYQSVQSVRVQEEIRELQERLERVKQLLPEYVDSMDLHDDNRRNLEMGIKKQLVSKADIICTTLGSCGSLTDYNQAMKFDVCIIDEATQCTEIASFTPLQYDVKKLILVGDVKQLPPLVLGKECAEAGLKNSLFARIQNSFIGTHLEGVKTLTTQYRMHPEILKWPNEYFYDGKLTSEPKSTSFNSFPFKPYTVFSLEYQQNMTQMEHQIYNNDEIQFVLKLLTEMIQYCERHTSIAIITPYTRHKRECEKFLFKKKITQVSVLSIDSVQGQEYDVVIISLARTVGTGFLDSPQRLNVALTRARKCLIMCGNFYDLKDVPVWSALLQDAEDRKLLYHIEDDDGYDDDVNSFVEKVMKHLRKPLTGDANH